MDEGHTVAELEVARRERAAGNAATAARRLAKLAESRPGRGDILFELGASEADRGRLTAAIAAWKKVPRGTTEFAKASLGGARLEVLLGRFSDAEDLLNTALEGRGAGREELRDTLVRLLRSEGRFAEARRRYLEGIDEDPDLISFLRRLHRIDVDPFATEGIQTYLDRAAAQAPGDDRVWLGRAHLETRLGRFDEAARRLDACLKRRADDPAVWHARLDWARAANRPDVVLECLARVPADEHEALEIRAWFAAQRGDRAGERQALERLLALDPGHATAYSRLAELAILDGHPDEAARLRARKARRDEDLARYEAILASAEVKAQAAELARLAGSFGWTFENECWTYVASGGKGSAPKPRKASPGTLASLLGDLSSTKTAAGDGAGATSRGPAAHFTDDAEAVGLRFVHENGDPGGRMIPPVTSSGGVGLLDYDGDGWLDVYCVQGGTYPPRVDPGRPGDRLYHNRGDGTFEDVTDSAGLGGERGYGHGVAVGDYDNDGRPDLFVTRWRAYALYHNRGDGTFEDVTDPAGLGGDRDWPTSAALADLDNDGDLDLYVCHYFRWDEHQGLACVDPKNPAVYHCGPRDFPALPDHAFRNDSGRFVDVTSEAGVVDLDGRGFGVLAADLDDDGRVDLFVANDTSANYLFRNRGGFRFEDTALASGVAANAGGGYQAGMGVASGDLDGDGRPDLAVTNFYNESTTFFRSLGDGLFADATAAVGLAAPSRYLLGFGIGFLDVNDDGRLDLMTVNGHIHDGRPLMPWTMPVQLLLGGEGGHLTDRTRDAGPPFQVLRMGRGLAVGDLDNDGRVDALVLSQNEPVAYFHNRTKGGGSLTLLLEGTASNRDAVGAKVVVEAGGRRLFGHRIGGGSYQSAGDPRLHFGLGDAPRADSVEVRWPSGRVDRHQGLEAGAGYRLREGEPRPLPLSGWKHDK